MVALRLQGRSWMSADEVATDVAPTQGSPRALQIRAAAMDGRWLQNSMLRTEPWNGEYENPERRSDRRIALFGEAVSFW
jgi:hypothetical protein